MSYSTYAQPFKIPDGFPELLAELTTEILREQPEDATGIYKFAYEFFLKKQQQGQEQPEDGEQPSNTEQQEDNEQQADIEPEEEEKPDEGG